LACLEDRAHAAASEYRFFYGDDADRLCVVLSGPIADRRRAFLENLKVAVLLIDEAGRAAPLGQLAHKWFGDGQFPNV